jgi:F0F1-type ATP synthase membrane subunit a
MIKGSGLIIVGSFIPLGLIFVLTFLELAVAAIQAGVFTILTIIYLNDAENLH